MSLAHIAEANCNRVCNPPPLKKRRIDPTSNQSINIMDNAQENVDYVNNQNNKNIHLKQEDDLSSAVIMETREILEHIHSFLHLEEILSSRQICRAWNEYFKIKIYPSQLSPNGACNLFPLYMRTMFEKEIGSFEQWLLFFISEYTNIEFKLKLNLYSNDIYPHYTNYGILHDHCWRSRYPQVTLFNLITSNQYKHYEKLLTMFMFERHKAVNASLHNILFCWLRGLKALSYYWLDIYDMDCIQSDLIAFHKQLSADYVEPEYGSIPFLQNTTLQKFDYLSSYLGLITMNGDFGLFYRFEQKIAANEKYAVLTDVFSKQHYPNHVYQHLHTFGFGYNVFGQCRHDLIDIVLKICDIPRSVCSLKVIRFVMQPHILVDIQSDLVLHKYPSGNILDVSLNKRIVLLKKLCFYFDLCATIHSSNLNRNHASDYLVYCQLKKPFIANNLEYAEDTNYCSNAQILNNFGYWKRYIVLCHLMYFVKKYEKKFNIKQYFFILFHQKPDGMSRNLWSNILSLIKRVCVIYPELKDTIKDRQKYLNGVNNESHYREIESYLNKQYVQYVSAITLMDCIGAIYSNEGNRGSLKIMERCGPLTEDQYETLRQCMLASQDIRNHFQNCKHANISLHDAIKNISFHDNEVNVNDDEDRDIGLMLKHGCED